MYVAHRLGHGLCGELHPVDPDVHKGEVGRGVSERGGTGNEAEEWTLCTLTAAAKEGPSPITEEGPAPRTASPDAATSPSTTAATSWASWG